MIVATYQAVLLYTQFFVKKKISVKKQVRTFGRHDYQQSETIDISLEYFYSISLLVVKKHFYENLPHRFCDRASERERVR